MAQIPPLPEPLCFNIKQAYSNQSSAYPQASPHPMYEGMRQPLTSGVEKYAEPDPALLAYEAAQSRVTLLASWNLWMCIVTLLIWVISSAASGQYAALVVIIVIIPGIPGAIRHIRWCICIYWIALAILFILGLVLAVVGGSGATVGAVILILYSGVLIGLSIWFFVEITKRSIPERLELKAKFKTCCC